MILMHYHFLIFFLKTYVVGTHLNCLDKSRHIKVEAIQMSTHNICFYKEVDKSTLAVI